MQCCTFTPDRHQRFARLSEDFNPIHIDPIASRRTHAGAPIVHGIHSMLSLLESLLEMGLNFPEASELRVQFRTPIYVGETCFIQILKITPSSVRAQLLVDDVPATVVRVSFSGNREGAVPMLSPVPSFSPQLDPPAVPANPPFESLPGLAGCLGFSLSTADVAQLFPKAHRYLGELQIRALMGTSCVVGMLAPGLNSLFVGLEVSLSGRETTGRPELSYVVEAVDSKFRMVRISISGGGLSGSLETIARPAPVIQPTMSRVREVVADSEFHDVRALVVGGSRGIGELAAKVIAAGGGEVIITYVTGKADAEAVAAEIRDVGARCQVIAYDVRKDAEPQLAALGNWLPSQLYYCATPVIASRKKSLYDIRRLSEFNRFYVTSFFDLVQVMATACPNGIKVLYPSSTYIKTRPAHMTEYAMSKASGEILCADINDRLPRVKILVRRLPPVLTDQTNSAWLTGVSDPLTAILLALREMQSL